MARVRQNIERLPLKAELRIADILELPAELFDAVLLDAPCSATGTIRRHPELPWLKSEKQIAELVGATGGDARPAAKFVKPGGRLVYCICSLEPEESEAQIESFLCGNPDHRRVPLTADDVAGQSQFITAQGDLRTLPAMNIGTDQALDGFYAARLMRL